MMTHIKCLKSPTQTPAKVPNVFSKDATFVAILDNTYNKLRRRTAEASSMEVKWKEKSRLRNKTFTEMQTETRKSAVRSTNVIQA